jgi:hypothetical protein
MSNFVVRKPRFKSRTEYRLSSETDFHSFPQSLQLTECNHPLVSLKVSNLWSWCLLPNSLERIPSWEANSRSASQEISSRLWNPKARFRVQKSPPFYSILRQMNPVRIIAPFFFKIRFNIILPFTPMSSKWSLFFLPKYCAVCIYHISHVCFIPHPFHVPSCNGSNNIWRRVEIMEHLTQLFPATFTLLGPGILHGTVFSDAPNLNWRKTERKYN